MATPIDKMPVEIDEGNLQTRYQELGELAIRHVSVPAGADMGPLLKGCHTTAARARTGASCCKDQSTSCMQDGTSETARAGEVYHWPAGHTGTTAEPCVFVEIGPVAEMRAFNEHVRKIFA